MQINDLLAAPDMERLAEALDRVVKVLRKKTYPSQRLPNLVEALSRDVQDRVVQILNASRIMALPYPQFVAALAATDVVVAEHWPAMLEVTAKADKRHKSAAARMQFALKQRLDALKLFRQQHDQLRTTIAKVMRPATSGADAATGAAAAAAAAAVGAGAVAVPSELLGLDAVEEVDQAYYPLERVDVLDMSAEGAQAWEAAEQAYSERVARVENAVISLLRDALAGARSASDMFRVLGRFNALFVRPKVRGAVQEYQASLYKKIDEDISALYEKFQAGYEGSQAAGMSHVRDIPSLSGKLIWAAQIERQLETYKTRLDAIYGKGSENDPRSQKLIETMRSFKAKLSREQIFRDWMDDIQRRDLKVEGSIFRVKPNRLMGNRLELDVNFDENLSSLFKEVRNLTWLNCPVRGPIASIANVSKAVYPFAVSLKETVNTYQSTNARVDGNPTVALLVAGHRKRIQSLIASAAKINWSTLSAVALSGRATAASSNEIAQIRELANAVSAYHDKANELTHATDEIVRAIDALRYAPYKAKAFRDILANVQQHVDQMSREALTNLDAWVGKLNERIEAILTGRLQAAIRAWIDAFVADLTSNRGAADMAPTTPGTPGRSLDESFDASAGANVRGASRRLWPGRRIASRGRSPYPPTPPLSLPCVPVVA